MADRIVGPCFPTTGSPSFEAHCENEEREKARRRSQPQKAAHQSSHKGFCNTKVIQDREMSLVPAF